ncbi:hypothetical protein EBR03_06840 [bacterium]|nr:hypothetical protein [bacterium]NBX82158.1 hypothetical protein [bacterium]
MKTLFNLSFIVLIALGWMPRLWAEEAAAAPSPQLSASGKRRMQENVQILLKSIETTESNISNSNKNIGTVSSQIEALEKIETQYGVLKEQYENFLEKARQEKTKNQEALNQLVKAPNRKLAQTEKTDREKWNQDTQKKITEVSELLRKLKADWAMLQTRKRDLAAQKAHWIEREKHHQTLLETLTAKKNEAEKQLKGDS